MPVDRATIDAPIARHPVKRQQMAVVEGGRPSRTHIEVLERFAGGDVLKARLETGRTHQIRVHMAYIGHPVAGDERYGAKTIVEGLEGHALHAAELAFVHPVTGESLRFTAPLPAGFAEYLSASERAGKRRPVSAQLFVHCLRDDLVLKLDSSESAC